MYLNDKFKEDDVGRSYSMDVRMRNIQTDNLKE
jgi:hypothetical protein